MKFSGQKIIKIGQMLLVALALNVVSSCREDVLTEQPLSFLSPDITLVNKAGFESAITALHAGNRELMLAADDWDTWWTLFLGTDIGTINAQIGARTRDVEATLTPVYTGVNWHWNWAYLTMLPRANQIIEYANRPTATWSNDAEKNAILAEARFFRGYVYNHLANIFGGVPIVDKVFTTPKLDFARSTRQEVLQFAKADLEFASQGLPLTEPQPGRITKDAADHLLTEVYISLAEYDKAIATATSVIGSGRNKLMTTRFGRFRDRPGDPYSDLFKDSNQNRSSGNTESLWVMQIEFQTPGGTAGGNNGNNWIRCWGPRYFEIRDPENRPGMVLADSIGRPVAWMRPSNHIIHGIWRDDPNDMRNSSFNMRRTMTYNNTTSKFFGQRVQPHPFLDTLNSFYPYPRKIEGLTLAGVTAGRTFMDIALYRLAETYLLRAEAHLLKGDRVKAAEDINVVRGRANAKPVLPAQVDIDYILDERLRELLVEEPRRKTLYRTGKLQERVLKYNGNPLTTSTFKPKHVLFPIPQAFIDANNGNRIEQNPGY